MLDGEDHEEALKPMIYTRELVKMQELTRKAVTRSTDTAF